MAKDYARQTPIDFDHSNNQSSLGGRSKKRLWLLVLLLAALACGGYYLYASVDFQEIEKKAVAKLPLKPKTTAIQQAKFEFYTRLPESPETDLTPSVTKQSPTNTPKSAQLQVSTKTKQPLKVASPVTKPTNKPVKATPSAKKLAANKKYHLQVGSFRHFKDADRLKASLLLDGFNVSVKSFTNENITWYRVFVGPYASLDKAKKMQLSLEEAEHNCLIKQTA